MPAHNPLLKLISKITESAYDLGCCIDEQQRPTATVRHVQSCLACRLAWPIETALAPEVHSRGPSTELLGLGYGNGDDAQGMHHDQPHVQFDKIGEEQPLRLRSHTHNPIESGWGKRKKSRGRSR
eukprot:25459-Chlamydomonas_euryale.AAC.1